MGCRIHRRSYGRTGCVFIGHIERSGADLIPVLFDKIFETVRGAGRGDERQTLRRLCRLGKTGSARSLASRAPTSTARHGNMKPCRLR